MSLRVMVRVEKTCAPEHCGKDWAGDLATFALVWGLPTATMLAAFLLEAGPRTVVWALTLTWMGGACLVNACRCGRTHCRYTGPFFLLMAAIVLAHGSGAIPFGPHGWTAIALMTMAGSVIIWWVSERLFGTFRRSN